jgi:ADP-dependent NAD(P)H-hydrate dehydratase / NAD(P)H-hydrate epimerase
MKLVTAAQMSAIEQSSVEAGVSLDALMENVGLAVAEHVRARFEDDNGIFGKRIVILIGSGNNGADGFVAGRHLADWGANVTALLCTNRGIPDPKRELAEAAGVSVFAKEEHGDTGVESFQQRIASTDLVIDAILGTGASRPITDPLAGLLFGYLESGVPVVALDLPTGLNSDTGEFDVAGLPADETLMLGYPKLGPALAADHSVTGEISILDIGIPEGFDSQVTTELLTFDSAISMTPDRPPDGHKGTFGSTLIIGGSHEYLGAVTMAVDAAGRSGVGLTFVATPEPAYRQVAGVIPEALYRSLPVTPDSNVDPSKAARIVLELGERARSVVIGPGLGNNSATAEFLSTVLDQLDDDTPLVLDADALNILSNSHKWWDRLANPAVLTPHPGEMGRLMGITTPAIQQDRMTIALEAASKFGKVVVLKGAATLIAAPDGRVNVSPWVNPGMAKGGSGDVLAGLIGGLLAQQPDEPFEMASLGVFIHGYAADIARSEVGETGMRATDVIARLGAFHLDFVQNNAE